MRRLAAILFRSFLQGLLILSPIAITAYVIYTVFDSVDRLLPYFPRGLGFLSVVALVTVVGYLGTRLFVGRLLFDAFNHLMEHTPGIKYIFPDATTFLGMVRKNYRAVYRHKSFEFGLSRSVDGVIIQDVQIIDTDGDAWAARYILERQPDGSLKINGCTLTKLVAA